MVHGPPTCLSRGASPPSLGPSFPPRRSTTADPALDDSANTLYYLNLTHANWYLSERPWLVAISPPTSPAEQAHVSVLTPAFELSRSQRLPFALTPEQRDRIDWVTWQEADDPYAVLLDHLAGLRGNESGATWSVEVEENVRTFVRDGLAAAASRLDEDAPSVALAKLEVRELRMRKTKVEGEIQHCVAKVRSLVLSTVNTPPSANSDPRRSSADHTRGASSCP